MALLAGTPVHRFADEIGVAVVSRVLLDHVEQDPSQAGCRAVGPSAPGQPPEATLLQRCLLYTSDAADERSSVDLGGRRIIKKKKHTKTTRRMI